MTTTYNIKCNCIYNYNASNILPSSRDIFISKGIIVSAIKKEKNDVLIRYLYSLPRCFINALKLSFLRIQPDLKNLEHFISSITLN